MGLLGPGPWRQVKNKLCTEKSRSMRRYVFVLMIAFTGFFTVLPTQKSHAFIWEVIKQGIKKVIKALDLKVQKMQNEVIVLQNAQKKLENAMSKLKLKEIHDWAEKQRKLYSGYYEELRKVKNYIATYKRIRAIMNRQLKLVEEYKSTYQLLRHDRHFSPEEIEQMARVYSGILDESVKNMEQIVLVINSFSTQMSDAKRLEIVSAAADRLDRNLSDLRQFNRQNTHLSLQRSKDQQEVKAMKLYYGIK